LPPLPAPNRDRSRPVGKLAEAAWGIRHRHDDQPLVLANDFLANLSLPETHPEPAA